MHEKVKKRLFIIDGYAYLFRAYHSMPPLTNPEGIPVGGVYGFTNMLTKLQNRIHATNAEEVFMIIAFDAGRKTFRNDIYPEYKANRPPPPEDLVPQFYLIRDAADAMNIKTLQKEGFEADDIIATYTRKAEHDNIAVTIVSSDKDLMQLVNPMVKMYDPMRDLVIDEDEVFKKFGVHPKNVLDMLALTGDSIDNIPGVPGIGPKTAAELINTYGDLEGVLNNAEQIKQNKRRETLIDNRENAIISKDLAKLNFEVPLDLELNELKIKKPETEKLFNFFNKHGFKSLIKNLEKNDSSKVEELNKIAEESKTQNNKTEYSLINNYKIINDEKDLKSELDNKIIKNISLYFYEQEAELKYISLNINNEVCYVMRPVNQESKKEQKDLFGNIVSEPQGNEKTRGNFDYLFKEIDELSKNKSITFKFFNLKSILNKKYISIPQSYTDLNSLNYILNGSVKNLEVANLAEKLNLKLTNIKELEQLDDPEKEKNIANYSYIIGLLSEKLEQELFEKKLNYSFFELDNRLIPILSKMERTGITVDKKILNKLSDEFGKKTDDLEKEIHKLAGQEFNIASPKQLGEILFDILAIEGGKKTKTGQYKTDSDKLETLATNGHKIADLILQWRSLSKLTNTYTKALVREINPDSRRVHTNFNITSTTTGRLSSNNPNLQNIPIRTEDGRKIRNAFIADEGKVLIGADYSQIELRLLAEMADIGVLKQAFKNNEDIHKATASQIFGVDIDLVDSEMRRTAKTVNFGIIYGQSAFGLAKQLRIGRKEAKDIIDKYFTQYPGIRKYMDETIVFAKEHEYVKTIHGRKIYLKGINDKNGMTRSFAERAAINAPLQGTASDIIKIAMIKIDKFLEKEKISANILLQIHDELIIECDKKIAEDLAPKIQKIMQNAVNLSIPLLVESKIGNHWGEIH